MADTFKIRVTRQDGFSFWAYVCMEDMGKYHYTKREAYQHCATDPRNPQPKQDGE